jgi:hypothetical protein
MRTSGDCWTGVLMAAVTGAMLVAPAAPAQPESPVSDLDRAVAAYRKVDPELLKDPSESKRSMAEMEAAWEKLEAAGETIHKAGTGGVARLKAELRKLDNTTEKDDFFKLSAASMLYAANGLAEAGPLAAIWSTTPLDVHFNSVFFPACQAGMTQDPRALPMLTACLKECKAFAFVARHSLTIPWPQTQMFIWGLYGPKGLPALHETLKSTPNPSARKSAMMVLAGSQYLPALETVRLMAVDSNRDVRAVALEALGCYGHPQDFKVIAAGLQDSDNTVREYALAGAAAYGDLWAVSLIIPLVRHSTETIRGMAFDVLLRLPTPDGWRAAAQTARDAKGEAEREALAKRMEAVLGRCQTSAGAFLKMTGPEQQAVVQQAVRSRRDEYLPKPGDKTLTHADLEKAAADWIKRERITGGDYAWVESRHVLAAATDKDIGLLLEVRGRVMRRLSDECLSEVSILDDLIQRLGRSRYRAEPGLTDKAESPGKAP